MAPDSEQTSSRCPGVLIVDDHPVYRDGLARAVSDRTDLRLVGEAGSGREALEQVSLLQPDVVVVDMRMPDFDGLGVIAMVGRDFPATQVLVFRRCRRRRCLSGACRGSRRLHLEGLLTRLDLRCDRDSRRGRRRLVRRRGGRSRLRDPQAEQDRARLADRARARGPARRRRGPSASETGIAFTSARRPSSRTCAASTRSSRWGIAPPRWPRRCDGDDPSETEAADRGPGSAAGCDRCCPAVPGECARSGRSPNRYQEWRPPQHGGADPTRR